MTVTTTPKIHAHIHECPELFGLSRAPMYRGKNQGPWNIYKIGVVALVKVTEVMAAIEETAA